MYNKMRIFLNYIGSRNFAVILLIVVTTVILIGNIIPNPSLMSPEEAMRFMSGNKILVRISEIFHVANITRHPLFLVFPVFIFLSVTICTLKRLKEILRRKNLDVTDRKTKTSKFNYSGFVSGKEEVMEHLSKKGWKCASRESVGISYLACRKGDGGFWGSLVFHVGMNIILIGGIITSMTLFNGRIMMTEGFPVEPLKELKKIISREESAIFPYQKMMVDSFEAVYESGEFPVDYIVNLKVTSKDGEVNKETIRINESLLKGGFQFILGEFYFTPRFIVTDRKGNIVQDAYINLLIRETTETDEFTLPSPGIKIRARLIPDFYKEGDVLMTRSKNLNNPAFMLEFHKGIQKLGDGVLPLNKKMDFYDGQYTIEFKDLRRWVILEISRDLGLPFIKLGFFMIVLGLSIRFMLNEREIWFSILDDGKETRLEMGGKALYFPALFEEEQRRISEELGLEAVEVKELNH